MNILNRTYRQILIGSEDKGENRGYTCCNNSESTKERIASVGSNANIPIQLSGSWAPLVFKPLPLPS
jgi:hypothetical protein